MAEPKALVDRLVAATNDHDLDAIAACFAIDYDNATPAHPARGFRGRAQVRRNWEQILDRVPDLHAEVVAQATDAATVWTEWVMTGTRLDGTAHEMRGVIVFRVDGGEAASARFYLEPVDPLDAATVDDAVRRQTGR
jgi:ketosteroid isomerase-like protein